MNFPLLMYLLMRILTLATRYMALLTFLTLSLSLSLSLTLASSPLFLGLWILLLALSLSLFLAFTSFHWLGLFIFIIYVGGLLVIFAYFVALAPNQLIRGKSLRLLTILSFFIFFSSLYSSSIFSNQNFSSLTPNSSIGAFFFSSNLWALFFIALILFFALVGVVKISSFYSGPLRPFSN